jgi:hypothetical protein
MIHISGNRDYLSSNIGDYRDSNIRVFRDNRGMDDERKQLRAWLQAELDRQGHGAKGKLAEFLGIGANSVSRMLNDDPGKEMRDIKANELARMREFFGTLPPIVGGVSGEKISRLVPVDTPKGSVRVTGKVAANTWLDVDDMDFDFDDIEYVPASNEYPISMQFGLLIEGNCLNKIASHGDRLVCLNIIDADYRPIDGDLVIVQRSKFAGQMIERTAKRLRRAAKGFELWPESTDPTHQDPIVLYEKPDGVDIQIIGKVLWIVRRP